MMEQVISLLEANDVKNFQVADKIIAKSIKGAPRFDTPIWPGYNVSITIQITDDEKAAKVVNLLKAFNKENAGTDDELLTVCAWELESYFID
jgi:hypothetical protein